MFSYTWNMLEGIPFKEKIEFIIKDWISHIELNQDKYGVVRLPYVGNDPFTHNLAVKYEQKILFKIHFYQSRIISADSSSIRSFTVIKRKNKGRELLDDDAITININEDFLVDYAGHSRVDLVAALMDLLPIRDSEKVHRIMDFFDVNEENIILDSFEKRYLIHKSQDIFHWEHKDLPISYYKYMSLPAFMKTLQNRAFRMHSIISQSDSSETFFLPDFLCGAYEDTMRRSRKVIKEKSILISSFSSQSDDEGMWQEYAKNDTGVCLTFRPLDNTKLFQVHYIDEKNTPLNTIRHKVRLLKDEGIDIYFPDIEKYNRLVKSKRFEKEQEWRLIVETHEPLMNDTYDGKTVVAYHDFPFQENIIPELGLKLTSVMFGSKQPINNFALLVEQVRDVFGCKVITNQRGLD